mmetsp:Transcript_20879/g.45403  ORF Transcript_20879/g.45403 Transcript_20879/m.45403 type:complete len:686 (+) Transcript_20879:84-2141(+)
MFYSQYVLAKKGPLGKIWLAAHMEKRVPKLQIIATNIPQSVSDIENPTVPMALRVSGHLLLGVVRIFSRKVTYLLSDCSDAMVKIKDAFRGPSAVDMAPGAATRRFDDITNPENFDEMELDAELPSQMMDLSRGLDDDLTIDDFGVNVSMSTGVDATQMADTDGHLQMPEPLDGDGMMRDDEHEGFGRNDNYEVFFEPSPANKKRRSHERSPEHDVRDGGVGGNGVEVDDGLNERLAREARRAQSADADADMAAAIDLELDAPLPAAETLRSAAPEVEMPRPAFTTEDVPLDGADNNFASHEEPLEPPPPMFDDRDDAFFPETSSARPSAAMDAPFDEVDVGDGIAPKAGADSAKKQRARKRKSLAIDHETQLSKETMKASLADASSIVRDYDAAQAHAAARAPHADDPFTAPPPLAFVAADLLAAAVAPRDAGKLTAKRQRTRDEPAQPAPIDHDVPLDDGVREDRAAPHEHVRFAEPEDAFNFPEEEPMLSPRGVHMEEPEAEHVSEDASNSHGLNVSDPPASSAAEHFPSARGADPFTADPFADTDAFADTDVFAASGVAGSGFAASTQLPDVDANAVADKPGKGRSMQNEGGHDPSSWSARTQKMYAALGAAFDESNGAPLSYDSMATTTARRHKRRVVAGCFQELLFLTTHGLTELTQHAPYGDIIISKAPAFDSFVLAH